MTCILSLDLGTTGNRCLAIDHNGKVVAQAYQEFQQYFPQPAWVEHDPIEIWTSTLQVLHQVLDQIDTSHVVCLGITNQRETTIAWNKQTGQPICPAIVWQCRRTASRCAELQSDYAESIRQKTGLPLDAYFSATKAEWIIQNVDEARTLIEEDLLCIGTVDTWIIWNLTKGSSFVTDYSNASRTMLFNIHTGTFDSELLSLFSVPLSCLPEVKDSDSCFGYTDQSITGQSFPIMAVLGDQQSSLFSQCGHDQTRLKNTYGTGLFVAANTGSEILKTDDLISTIAWRIGGQTSYAVEGSIFIGGSVIQWCRDQMKMVEYAQETDALARSIKDNEGVYFVPALAGLGAPYWDSDARGMIIGLTRGTSQVHIIRAALESLAYQTKDVIMSMGDTFSTLCADGGAVSNEFLMQFQSDILQMKVETLTISETTALGVAGLAGIASNVWTDTEFRSFLNLGTSYTPSMSLDQSNVFYKQWQQAVKRSLKWV